MTGLVVAMVGQMMFLQAARAQTPPPAAAPPAYPPAPGAPPPVYAPPPGAPPAGAYDAAPPQLQQPMLAPPVVGPVVILRADKPRTRLQQMRLQWQDVCTAPCGVPVDPTGTYRVGGGSVRGSEEFRMPRPSGRVTIDAQVGSTVKHWVGVGMIIGGLAFVASGAFYYADTPNSGQDLGGGTTGRDLDHGIGIGYMIVGAIVAAIGIPLAMSSTSVEVR
jgi:hypothetical protein